MRNISRFAPSILLIVLTFGCQNQNHDEIEPAHEHGSASVTIWTEKSELFMEHPVLIVGQETAFAVHLTDLSDFKPVTSGRIISTFKMDGTDQVRAVSEAPNSPGIFQPVVKFPQAGVYEMELRLEGPQVSDIIRIPGVRVYENRADLVEHEEGADHAEETISFLKEQQWKIDFRTEPVQKRRLNESVKAIGEIMPRAQSHAEVPALVDGIILADQNANIPSVGTWVKKGQVLAVISPPADMGSGFTRLRNEYLLAKAEFERSRRLFDRQAIPKKRLEEARLRYETSKASYDVIAGLVDFGPAKGGEEAAVLHYHLKAPIDGILEEINFHIGQTVKASRKLFTITDPRRVWLKARVPLALFGRIKNVSDASFKAEDSPQIFRVSELGGRLISVGSIVDKESRTVPVIFEMDNPGGRLKINMFAEVYVQTGETVEALVIPTSAIIDDSGTPVTYEQVEGELFAKRALQTGISDNGFTQVLSGIAEGERVVTVGGYQVRLASLSSAVPSGHGHEH